MIEHLSLPSLLAILVTVCSLFVITGVWLFVLITRSNAAQVTVAGFGVSVSIDTRLSGRRRGDMKQKEEVRNE